MARYTIHSSSVPQSPLPFQAFLCHWYFAVSFLFTADILASEPLTTELSKLSSVNSCCPVSRWSAWPWFHFPQEWAHWKQSACGFQCPSSGWLQQNATLSNKDYMLPTFPPIHTLALLDSLQRFQPKNLSQKLRSLSNHYHEVQFLWQLRRWVIPAVPGALSSPLT